MCEGDGMEEWKEYKLEEICTKITDGSHFSPQACQTGYPMFSVKDMLEYGFDYSNCKYISKKDFESMKSGDCVPQKGDILVAKDGSFLKQIFECKETKEEAILSSIAIFRPNQNIITPTFLCYLLKSPKVYNYIALNCVSGSALPRIVLKDFKKVTMQVPPLPTQQKIAAILSSLDDKIELNNKINTNLEQQAGALFKNWFVDFEPFGGKMPEGWKVGTIGDLCSTISKTYKSNDSHVVLINTSDVENGIILNHESVPNSNLKGQFKKTFQKGDILYSEIRPANKHYAFVDIDTTSNYIASTKLMVIRPNEDINPHYLYHILTNPDLIQEMQHLAETRSGTFPQITFESELSTYQIPLLPKEEQDKLGELFEKIDNQIFHNIKENKMLSTIRDTLLPKVMNGEIEV